MGKVSLRPGESLMAKRGKLATLPGLIDAGLSAMGLEAADTPGVVVDPAKVIADPKRFQFKEATGPGGTTGILSKVKKWDPIKGDRILIWTDKGGRSYVVDGHHRLELAQRLQRETGEPKRIEAFELMENAGITDKQARALGAMRNLAAGRGTATDAARFFRDAGVTPERLEAEGVSLTESTVGKAIGLASLTDSVWRKVVNGTLTEAEGAAIGEAMPGDDLRQRTAAKELAGKRLTAPQIRQLAELVAQAPSVIDGKSLFGASESLLFVERAKVLAAAARELKTDKRVFGTLDRRLARIERTGANRLDADANKQQKSSAERGLMILERLAGKRGPVANAVNEGAEAVREAGGSTRAINTAARRVLDVVAELPDSALVNAARRPVKKKLAKKKSAKRKPAKKAKRAKKAAPKRKPAKKKRAKKSAPKRKPVKKKAAKKSAPKRKPAKKKAAKKKAAKRNPSPKSVRDDLATYARTLRRYVKAAPNAKNLRELSETADDALRNKQAGNPAVVEKRQREVLAMVRAWFRAFDGEGPREPYKFVGTNFWAIKEVISRGGGLRAVDRIARDADRKTSGKKNPKKSATKAKNLARSAIIAKERRAGKPAKQAAAIAYKTVSEIAKANPTSRANVRKGTRLAESLFRKSEEQETEIVAPVGASVPASIAEITYYKQGQRYTHRWKTQPRVSVWGLDGATGGKPVTAGRLATLGLGAGAVILGRVSRVAFIQGENDVAIEWTGDARPLVMVGTDRKSVWIIHTPSSKKAARGRGQGLTLARRSGNAIVTGRGIVED